MTEFFPLLVEVPKKQSLPILEESIHRIVYELYPNIKALCNHAIEKYNLTNPLFVLRLIRLKNNKYVWDLYIESDDYLFWIGGER